MSLGRGHRKHRHRSSSSASSAPVARFEDESPEYRARKAAERPTEPEWPGPVTVQPPQPPTDGHPYRPDPRPPLVGTPPRFPRELAAILGLVFIAVAFAAFIAFVLVPE